MSILAKLGSTCGNKSFARAGRGRWRVSVLERCGPVAQSAASCSLRGYAKERVGIVCCIVKRQKLGAGRFDARRSLGAMPRVQVDAGGGDASARGSVTVNVAP